MLYQKVRPRNLDEFAGNAAAKTALANVIASTDRPHAFLFTGPSGTGKTTLARILAAAVGCQENYIVEINAADKRGIDDVRQIIGDASFQPFLGSNRTFLIDETHMLTKEAQNCVLKALEDVPAHQYYILCSTDPQKLLPTIKTRCARVEVSALNEADMLDMLLASVERAGIPMPSDNVLAAIVSAAGGGSRQALMLLEQANGMDEQKALSVIRRYEGAGREVIDLCRAVVKGRPWREISAIFQAIPDRDAEGIRRACLGYLKACLLGDDSPGMATMIDILSANTFDSGEPQLVAMLYKCCQIR